MEGVTERLKLPVITLVMAGAMLVSSPGVDPSFATHRISETMFPSGIGGGLEFRWDTCVENPPSPDGEHCANILSIAGRPWAAANFLVGSAAQPVYEFEVPGILLAGSWKFDLYDEYAGRQYLATTNLTIDPGFKNYDLGFTFDIDYTSFTVNLAGVDLDVEESRSSQSKTRSVTCNFSGSVVGINLGDPFVIGGPCVVKVNQDTAFPLYLLRTDVPNKTVEKVPILDNIYANGSQLYVGKRDEVSGLFTPHRFYEVSTGSLVSGGAFGHAVSPDLDPPQGNPVSIRFLDPGTYEMEVVWRMLSPPDGTSEAEVSRATKFVTVLPDPPDGTGLICGGGGSCFPPGTVLITPDSNAQVKPSNLTPGSTQESMQEITLKIPGLSTYRLAFLAERKAGSGGHAASKHNKVGSTDSSGLSDGGDVWATYPLLPIGSFVGGASGTFKTAGDGVVKTTYVASEFGGEERVRIFYLPDIPGALFAVPGLNAEGSVTPPPGSTENEERQRILKEVVSDKRFKGCQLGAVEINVKVPDLELLPDGSSDYAKNGGTPRHLGPPSSSTDNNHYGTNNMVNEIKTLAPILKSAAGATPHINDMSLPNGGLFDKNGNWQTPHSRTYGHATGRAADLDYFSESEKREWVIELNRNSYTKIDPSTQGFTAFGYILEPGHIHIMR